MRLKRGFITHNVGEHQMMVAAGPAAKLFHGMVQSNGPAALIVDCLKKSTTEDETVDAILQNYTDVDRETVVSDVREVLAKLRSIHALEE